MKKAIYEIPETKILELELQGVICNPSNNGDGNLKDDATDDDLV